jgi:sporulation protein YlmC with PRC-barrel domain
MSDAGRVMHAGLQLLDRQLVDRTGRLCGKVDDLELSEPDEHGVVHVTAVLTGPGALMCRVGRKRLGSWLRRLAAVVVPSDRDDPVRVPFGRVADIGDHVTLSLEREEVATFGGERWARDHVVAHIPGSGHRADR